MPTLDATERLRLDEVRPLIERSTFAAAGRADQRGIGVEVEAFGFHADGGHVRRLTVREQAARLDAPNELAGPRVDTGPVAKWPCGQGWLSFEPGGQLEYSSGVHATAAELLDDLDAVLDALATRWWRDGDVLVGVGHDLFCSVDDVAQQLDAPRYRAMDAFLAERGPWGRHMMRHTCALQVNLDPGTGIEADRRWRLANLAAPLVTATFACSPALPPDPAVSVRARAWRRLDPSRTGIVGLQDMAHEHDRIEAMARFALAAEVMLVADAAAARAAPNGPPRTFEDWLADPDPDPAWGWPTADDLHHHLTTLFPEVRARGPLEIRSIDALPRQWRAVPVVLLTGLLYDPGASAEGLRLLAPRAGQLADDLVRASESGCKDAELCAVAVEVWSLALEGARRLGPGWHRPRDLAAATDFIDRFTMRGLSPADEVRDRFLLDPSSALQWLAEPVGSTTMERR